jgi:hypothetical protein
MVVSYLTEEGHIRALQEAMVAAATSLQLSAPSALRQRSKMEPYAR